MTPNKARLVIQAMAAADLTAKHFDQRGEKEFLDLCVERGILRILSDGTVTTTGIGQELLKGSLRIMEHILFVTRVSAVKFNFESEEHQDEQ